MLAMAATTQPCLSGSGGTPFSSSAGFLRRCSSEWRRCYDSGITQSQLIPSASDSEVRVGDLAPKISIGKIILRSAIAQVPVLGAVINEVLTETLPDLKAERLGHLLEHLEARVLGLEDGTTLRKLTQPIFADLLEDGIRSASRSTSRLRQEHIAALIANGLAGNEERALSRRYLLGLLDQLNDAELLMLIGFSRDGGAFDAFFRTHESTLAAPFVPFLAEGEQIDRAAVFEDYQHHLERLRLIEPAQNDAATAQWGDRPVRRQVTQLGMALLRAIDQSVPTGPGPSGLLMDPDRVRSFWFELMPVLEEFVSRIRPRLAETGHHIQFGTNDINVTITLLRSGPDIRLSGFVHPSDRWIWLELTGGVPLPKCLVRIGTDAQAPFWEHEGQRRTSKEQLAQFIVKQLLVAAELSIVLE